MIVTIAIDYKYDSDNFDVKGSEIIQGASLVEVLAKLSLVVIRIQARIHREELEE